MLEEFITFCFSPSEEFRSVGVRETRRSGSRESFIHDSEDFSENLGLDFFLGLLFAHAAETFLSLEMLQLMKQEERESMKVTFSRIHKEVSTR